MNIIKNIIERLHPRDPAVRRRKFKTKLAAGDQAAIVIYRTRAKPSTVCTASITVQWGGEIEPGVSTGGMIKWEAFCASYVQTGINPSIIAMDCQSCIGNPNYKGTPYNTANVGGCNVGMNGDYLEVTAYISSTYNSQCGAKNIDYIFSGYCDIVFMD